MITQKRVTNNPKNPYTIETDYRAITQKRVTAQNNTTTFSNYEITIDMAKEISMIQNKGEC